MVGKVCQDYTNGAYKKDKIGQGGFGKVYKLNEKLAVKEEYKVLY